MIGNKKPIRVLHVVGAMNRAGTESMLMNIYRTINRNKYEFDFVSYDEGEADFDKEIYSLGGQVIALSKTNSMKQLYTVMKLHGPYDVVHAHTLFHCGIVCFAAFLARINVRIAHAHTTADDKKRQLRKIYIFMMRLLISIFSTNKLACSEEAGKYLFGKYKRVKQQYHHFPNVINDKEFLNVDKNNIEKLKQELKIKKDHLIIGHIGTFKKSKNHQFILKIMEVLVTLNPKVELLLIGEGELKQEIEEHAKQMKLIEYIKFLGIRDDIPTILRCMDVFVFPSIYEGLGMVLLEAQASGIPCIVSEAIQPEADVGIGLIETISLRENPSNWAKKLIQKASENTSNDEKIKYAFNKNKHTLTNSLELLQQLYRME